MKVEFLEPAYNEYIEAIDFYNLQSENLGKKFIAEVDRTISIIKNFPSGFSSYTKHTRKAVVNIFPYNIIYFINDDCIVIAAVAHQHRKPSYWVDRYQ